MDAVNVSEVTTLLATLADPALAWPLAETRFPGLTFEQGFVAGLRWLLKRPDLVAESLLEELARVQLAREHAFLEQVRAIGVPPISATRSAPTGAKP